MKPVPPVTSRRDKAGFRPRGRCQVKLSLLLVSLNSELLLQLAQLFPLDDTE